jgi:hypothetical protein
MFFRAEPRNEALRFPVLHHPSARLKCKFLATGSAFASQGRRFVEMRPDKIVAWQTICYAEQEGRLVQSAAVRSLKRNR